MKKLIYCHKLQEKAEALPEAPMPGKIGEKILNEISQTGWDQWLAHQTMLINEYRLNLLDEQAHTFLMAEMEKFLFGDGSETPPEYQPQNKH